jgi:hypothetical protein
MVSVPISDTSWQLSLQSDVEISTYFWTSEGGSLNCWDCPNPILTGPGRVQVIYDYNRLCTGDTSVVFERKINTNIVLPNIISIDNGSIQNQSFTVSAPEGVNMIVEEFLVFDRWGNVVHKVKNTPVNISLKLWEGKKNGNRVENGVYVYIMRYNINGESKTKKGDITVTN